MLMMLSTVFFLSLAAGVFHAAATPIWPDTCSNVSTDFSVPSTVNSDYEAAGCKFLNSFTKITFPTALASGNFIRVTVSDGSVAPGINSGIGIIAPSYMEAQSMGNLQITVKGMSFGQDAVLSFIGGLPPGSFLTISGNSFYQTVANSNAATNSLIVAMSLGNSFSNLLLTVGSVLSVTNNTFKAAVASTYASINIYFGNVTVSDGGLFNISGNALVSSTINTASYPVISVVNWAPMNVFPGVLTPLTVSDTASATLNGNSISQLYAVASGQNQNAYVYVINFQFQGTVTNAFNIASYASLTMNGNFISNSSVTSQNWAGRFTTNVVYMFFVDGDVIVDGYSSVAVDGNFISNDTTFDTGYVVNLQFGQGNTIDSMTFSDNSVFSIQNNSISDTLACSSSQSCWAYAVNLVFPNVNIYGVSTLTISGNELSSIALNGMNAFALRMNLATTFFVTDSSFNVDRNTLSHSSGSTQSGQYTVLVYAAESNIVLYHSKVSMSNNSAINTTWVTLTVAAWYLQSNFTLVGSSTFTTSGNYAINCNLTSLTVASMVFVGLAIVFVGESSKLLFNDNSISYSTTASTTMAVTFVINSNNQLSQAVIATGHVEMCRNSIASSIVSTSQLILCNWQFQPFNVSITNFSTVLLSDNTATNVTLQPSSSVYISYLEIGQLSLMHNSTFTVQRSVIIGVTTSTLYIISTTSVAILNGSVFGIIDNNITVASTTPTTRVNLFAVYPSLTLAGTVQVEGNSVSAPTDLQSFLLINANAYVPLPDASILACNNTASWDTTCFSYPARYLTPQSLAQSASPCVDSSPTTAQPDDKKSNTGVIAGAVIGSIVGIGLVAAGIVFFRRHRSSGNSEVPFMRQEKGYSGIH